MKDTFCILPWIHLHTWPNGNVYQCCITNFQNPCGSLKDNSLEEIWNNDYMKDLRRSMISGEEHKSCERCYKLEESGLQSFRKSINSRFKKYIPIAVDKTSKTGTVDEFKLLYWDFRFNNICNFKCRMCGSALSSSWYDDHVALSNYKVTEPRVITIDDNSKISIKEYIQKFIDYVEEIYFAGGEPLVMEEHYYILDELVKRNRQDVKIRYNTNLSKLKYRDWNVLDYWRSFKGNVEIYASIDGHGDVAEYIRKGTNWKVIEKNLKQIIEFDPYALGISSTVQIFNIFQLPELVDKLLKLGIRYDKILISNVLTYPPYYSINLLSDDLKSIVKKRIDGFLSRLDSNCKKHFEGQFRGIIDYMYSSPDDDVKKLRKQFKLITISLDQLRNESYKNIFPQELVHWIDSLES